MLTPKQRLQLPRGTRLPAELVDALTELHRPSDAGDVARFEAAEAKRARRLARNKRIAEGRGDRSFQ